MAKEIVKFVRQKDYKYIKDIGRGATGITVLLKDELIDQLFICKKYQPAMGIDPTDYYSKFVNEIKMMYLINNRNVVRVYNYYLYPSIFSGYILMEYIDGSTITDYVSWNPEKIDDIFIQTIQGFSALEEKGVLHRDIRDSNILVSNDGVVKVIDLGFGKQIKFESDFDKSISLNWWCATPMEFIQKRYDYKTEIYFVGKLFEKIIMDNGLSDFTYMNELRKMIEFDPNNRINSFNEIMSSTILKNEIENVFNDDEISAYRYFSLAIGSIYAKIENNSKYQNDINIIISKLEDCYNKNMLEEELVETKDLASIFVQGEYTYYRKSRINIYTIKNFLKLLKGASTEKRRIIMLNLENKLNSVEHFVKKDETLGDDIPF